MSSQSWLLEWQEIMLLAFCIQEQHFQPSIIEKGQWQKFFTHSNTLTFATLELRACAGRFLLAFWTILGWSPGLIVPCSIELV